MSRLNESDWNKLKQALSAKQIKLVALDLPTSWIMAGQADEFTNRMFEAINGVMLDMSARLRPRDNVIIFAGIFAGTNELFFHEPCIYPLVEELFKSTYPTRTLMVLKKVIINPQISLSFAGFLFWGWPYCCAPLAMPSINSLKRGDSRSNRPPNSRKRSTACGGR